MTQAEFLAYCKIYPSQVNVWYTDTAPYTIQGMSVPVLDLNLDDNTPFLTQVEKVTIPLPGGGTVTLDITQISITTVNTIGQGATSFFFLLTTPSILTGTLTSNVIAGNLSFSPAINGIVFNASPYNTIGGVVQNTRLSKYIMESDRNTVGIPGNPSYTGPTNITQLLSYSSSKADIQDTLEITGVDISRSNIPPADLPATLDELELHMQLSYKQAIEIAEEEAINTVLKTNKYDLTRKRVNYDLTTIGIAAVKTSFNKSEGIVIDYVDPAYLVYSYTEDPNFDDIYYVGEVKAITIAELKKTISAYIRRRAS